MFRRRSMADLHRGSIRLSLFDAIVLAPVIAVPLLLVVSLALFSMVALLVVTGFAVAATIVADAIRRQWRSAKQPIVVPRRAIG
jgi:preprotein translocase subunit SecF